MGNSDQTYTWNTGSAYHRYVGRWSQLVGAESLTWPGVPKGKRWLDVGCGTGTLSGLIQREAAPARVDGIDPSAGFVDYARKAVSGTGVTFSVGDARNLPFPDQSFDAVVSGLVLNFVPPADQARAVTEMVRVTEPGGTVAAYVWDYADGMEMMRHFWEAAVSLDPAAEARAEAIKFPLCHPGPLRDLFAAAGLSDVETRAIDVPTVFADFDDYWTPFLSGEAPAPGYNMSLSDEARANLREELRRRLPTSEDGSIRLTARAWAVRGTVQ